MWRDVRGLAGAVMCETRDVGINWPRLPKRREEDARATGKVSLLGSRARVRRTEGGYLAGAGSGLAAKENEGRGGLKGIEMMRGRYFWKEAGCRRDSSTELVTRRKAQKSTGSSTAQNGTKSDGDSRCFQKMGA